MHKLIPLTGFVLLAGCASTHAIDPAVASADFSGAQEVSVTLSNFKFTPAKLHLVSGKRYVLHLVNKASGGHDFTAPDFFASAKIAPADVREVRDGQIDLGPNREATIHLIPSTGTFKIVCTHTGHALLGMKGEIVVS